MDKKVNGRLEQLKKISKLTDEQLFEIKTIDLKSKLSNVEYYQHINKYLSNLDIEKIKISTLDYGDLIELGYTFNEIINKTLAVSSDEINGYQAKTWEQEYWLEHRKNNMNLYVCVIHAGIILAHFSMTSVLSHEKEGFLQGDIDETDFTVMARGEVKEKPHYVYISAVAVRKNFQDTAVSTYLIRQGYRMLNKHLSNNPMARGYFSEAYSPEGERLCRLFGMSNLRKNYFVRER